MTMALPLAFAACTSDEFESQGVDINLAERTEIGQVDLLLNQGEAETRWGGDMLPEVSDVFGAALVDAPRNPKLETEKGKWYNDYEVKDYISTNYPYTFNGNRWTSEAKLVEGNYLFYAPYAEDHQVRSAIKYAAPVVQDLKVENGAVVENSALADVAENFKSPFYFAYKFFDAADDNRNLSLTMRPIFAYPKFTLKNNTGEAVTITRIVLQSENLDIPASGEFNNSAIVTAMNDSEKGWGRPTADYVRGANDNVDTEDLLNTGAESYVKTNLIRADLSEPVTIANNGTMTFNLVVPAMEFAKRALKVYFVNEEDMGYVYENTNSTVRFVPARPNPKEEYNVGTGAALNSAGRLLTKTLAADEPLEAVPYIVTTTAELIDAIDNATPNQNRPLKLTIGGDIEFNADVLGAIAENLSQPVVFVGALDIVGSNDAAKPLNINQKIIFDEATITGNVQFGKDANGQAAVGFESIEVVENAALTIDALAKGFGSDGKGGYAVEATNASIVNNGTLTLKTAVKAVENNATLNIEKDGKFNSLSTKNTETHPEIVNINSDYTLNAANMVGQWTVKEKMTLTLGQAAALPYGSTLTVNGALKGADLKVSGTMNLNGRTDANIALEGVVDRADTETNETKPAVLNIGSKGDVTSTIKGLDTYKDTSVDKDNNDIANSIRDAQTVNLAADFVDFFGTMDDANLMVKYTYTGNVTDNIEIPAIANNVTIDGSVAAGSAEQLKIEWTNVDSLTVTGNVQALNNSIWITIADNGSARIGGDARMSKALRINGAAEIEVKGVTYTTEDGGLKSDNAKRVIFHEFRISGDESKNDCWNLSEVERFYMLGEMRVNQNMNLDNTAVIAGDIILAENKELELKKDSYIDGEVEISGGGKVLAENVTINVTAGNSLTNRATIEGRKGQKGVKFDSLTEAGETRGQVYNYGTIQYVGEGAPYNSEKYGDWWNGNAAL